MERIISNVFLDGISLVTKNEAPAVEQAETKFALFKTVQKSNDSLDILINLNKTNLNQIKENLKK